jgi:hypothetical protein
LVRPQDAGASTFLLSVLHFLNHRCGFLHPLLAIAAESNAFKRQRAIYADDPVAWDAEDA